MSSQRVICTVGPTSSGKTTWAEEMVRSAPTKYVNLNRDDYRFSLFGCRTWSDYKFNKHSEALVTKAIKAAATEAINMSKTVIVSDTNMAESVQHEWKEFADSMVTDFELKFFAPGSLETLLERNRYKGPRGLPEHVVKRQYDQYMKAYGGVRQYRQDYNLPKCVIFDLDGTLFDNSQRGPFQWNRVLEDAPRPSIVELFNMYKDRGYSCLTVSGRDGVSEADSLEALRRIGCYPDAHFQRATGDSRPDDIVKEEIFWEKIAPAWNVFRAIDDRTKVVDMWRRIGLECWQVQPGDF
ncbi:polynucleotide kinase [Aeromonas phage avDM5]|uniref:Polynucleotide kinase n=1 Tax=Aeromonas phage vB_AehM_DM2 TaxID=2973716 RepID=A0AA95C435_9CAUD|nr:polynucleotide kinase [Aeromonas phage avDM5]UYD60517.1 polynucleotide kinase [Aeromonas phage avDM2]UYD60647.1 polynucleotide kinase [Aeromonas phage avDM2]